MSHINASSGSAHRRTTGLVVLLAAGVFGCEKEVPIGEGREQPETNDQSLTGTWDVVATHSTGPPKPLVVTLSPDRLQVLDQYGSLLAVRSGNGFDVDLEYAEHDRVRVTQLGESTMDLGAIPIDVSGEWDISKMVPDPAWGCSSSFDSEGGSANCRNVTRPATVDWFPRIAWGGAVIERLTQLPSIFGELGGEFRITLSGGDSCLVRFEGDTLHSSCDDSAPHVGGWLRVQIQGSTASGSTSNGLEFSAQRR